MTSKKIIFITGTDTGVGKTILTALLLHHLRSAGVHALATKPFCSGGTGDVRLLQSLQRGEISDREMNPFYFAQPLAPLVAASRSRAVRLGDAVTKIKSLAQKCDCLLVEGSGGLLVPLGPGYTVADLIVRLNCQAIVAARNRLGTINHTLLTVHALRSHGIHAKDMAVILMVTGKPDLSSQTNPKMLRQLLSPIPVFNVKSLGKRPKTSVGITQMSGRIRSELRKLSRKLGFSRVTGGHSVS